MVIISDKNLDSPMDSILGELIAEGSSSLEESLQNKVVEECEKNGKEAAAEDENNKGSEPMIGLETKAIPKIIEVPYPEFYDFNKDKTEECFAVDQMWAVYDGEGMPRLYARIKKVFSPSFKVHINLFEPDPNGQDENHEIDRIHGVLPVGCGKFVKEKKTWSTGEVGMFSHRVNCEKGSSSDSCRIYPRKGETWAFFKNWDIRWSSDPENHRNFEYGFVEVLSNYSKESGINVAYLVKTKGFVSLFKPTKTNGLTSFQIPPNELLRFSHRVPSYRTTGKEREDVSKGYFELDPASLPGDVGKIYEHLHSRKDNVKRIHAKCNSFSNFPEEGSPNTSKKRKNPDKMTVVEGENKKTRNRLPRILDWSYKKKKFEESASYHVDKTYTGSDGVNVNADRVEQSSSSPSLVDCTEIPDAEFYYFDGNKSHEKFKCGQIWALYCDLDALPKFYGQIKRVEFSPNFRLEIKWLNACYPLNGVIDWLDKKMPICCGAFTRGETLELDDTYSFSHLLTGVTAGKDNKYEIYPRKGDVWALYRNFNTEWSCFDLLKCEYDMVEVVENSGDTIKVLVLSKLQGFVTVFKGQREAGREFSLEIPRVELFRFSHQVPAFQLTDERNGKLQGCWELDPKAMPVCLYSLGTHNVSTFGTESSFTYQTEAEKINSDSEQSSMEQSDGYLKGDVTKIDEPFDCSAHVKEDKEVKKQKQKQGGLLEESIQDTNDKAEACKRNGKEAVVEDDSSKGPQGNKEILEVPDTDFFDFGRVKSLECFAVEQMWAIYDDIDGMPRFYARIKKVYTPGFKVQITWIDPFPEDEDEIDWHTKKLPIACGRFQHEKTEHTENLGIFSHRVDWEEGTSRGSYRIYPRKNETWALFKNWDIKWISDPYCHRHFEYEFVEIRSDYKKESGINVVYLVKINGFVSLFKPTINNGMTSFHIPPSELFRFSHRVPSFRTTGREREDVPEGYFELDPASLPGNIEEITNPLHSIKDNVDISHVKFNGSAKFPAEESPYMPKKWKNLDGNDYSDRGNSRTGNCSQRLPDGSNKKKRSEECAGYPEKNRTIADSVNVDIAGQSSSSPPLVDPNEIPDADFYNFDSNKSHEKFKRGQIWALYCDLDTLPKFYGQIKRVELSPYFRVETKWLEGFDRPTGMIQWLDKKMPICCGAFTRGETAKFDQTDSFSHLITGVTSSKENKYEIYPRKGDVWALYRNFNSGWSCSDLNDCDYDLVEVVEESGDKIKVLVLSKLLGFKTVFKVKIKAGREFFMEILRVELLRFSHQIPAFKLTNERDGKLQGCWDLDPKAMPVCLLSSETHGVSTFGRRSEFICVADAKEMGTDGLKAKHVRVTKQSSSSFSHLKPCELREAEFYNFENDKTREKFQPGQIWAIYSDLDGMPRYYVQIRRVELFPDFKLDVIWFNACTPPEEVTKWLDKKMPISCGMFSVGLSGIFKDTASFSHQARGLPTGKRNKYEILPRKGEVWALYRKCSSEWSCYDLHKCDYDMIEVVQDNFLWIVVSILRQVTGFETVFKAKRKAGRKIIIGVARFELLRFSHQVPAFRLTDEHDGSLGGCWELDRKSIPVCLFSC